MSADGDPFRSPVIARRLVRFFLRVTRTPERELAFVVGYCGTAILFVKALELLGGPPAVRAGLIVLLLVTFLLGAVLLRLQAHRERRRRVRRLRERETPAPATVSRRFRRHFKNAFTSWSVTWGFLWLVATIYALIEGRWGDFRTMTDGRGLLALSALVAAGVPLALAAAGVCCWFRDAEGEDAV